MPTNDEHVSGVKISTFPSAQSIDSPDLVTGLKNNNGIVTNTNFTFSTILAWVRQRISEFYIPLSARGQANGVASLNESGKVPVGQIPSSNATPEMDGAGSAGSALAYARSDHQHPSDTSKISTSVIGVASGVASLGNDGKVPSAQLPTIPSASSATPQNLGTAAAGSSTDYSRADHVHNKPTYSASDVGLGNVDNIQQYSASNPPPYPVTSVNGNTGAVTVSVPSAYTSNPAMDGTASPGSSGAWARGDHVHPSDTSKANQTQLAYVETGTTASRNYSTGVYVCWNGLLYTANQAISSGTTLSAGTGGNLSECVGGGFNDVQSFNVSPASGVTINSQSNYKIGNLVFLYSEFNITSDLPGWSPVYTLPFPAFFGSFYLAASGAMPVSQVLYSSNNYTISKGRNALPAGTYLVSVMGCITR